MDKYSNTKGNISAQPRLHQHAAAIQPYGTVNHALPLELKEPVRLEMTERLNQLLADTIHHSRPLQKVTLASCWSYLLSAASAFRQALRRTGRTGRLDRRTNPIAGWCESGNGR